MNGLGIKVEEREVLIFGCFFFLVILLVLISFITLKIIFFKHFYFFLQDDMWHWFIGPRVCSFINVGI